MAVKKENLIIRVSPGFKKRIEKTAESFGTDVSTFVRDILSIYIGKNDNSEHYINILKTLYSRKEEEIILKDEIINTVDQNKRKEYMLKLVEIQSEIYIIEKQMLNYMNKEDI